MAEKSLGDARNEEAIEVARAILKAKVGLPRRDELTVGEVCLRYI